MTFEKCSICLVVPRHFSACCPWKSVQLMLCATFRPFQFCPHKRAPWGNESMFSTCRENKRYTDRSNTSLLWRWNARSSRPMISWSSLICSWWVYWSRGTRMQTHELEECLSLEMWRSSLSLLSDHKLHFLNVFFATQPNVRKKTITETPKHCLNQWK